MSELKPYPLHQLKSLSKEEARDRGEILWECANEPVSSSLNNAQYFAPAMAIIINDLVAHGDKSVFYPALLLVPSSDADLLDFIWGRMPGNNRAKKAVAGIFADYKEKYEVAQ